MNHAKNLDNASGKLFLIGFIATKLRLLPLPFVADFLSVFASGCYLIGYALWLMACHFHPTYQPKKESWYGFTHFKNQNRIAAGLGFVAVALALTAFAFPTLVLPGACVFAISNVVWCVAEYHKRQNPPADPAYKPERQNYYLSYAILSTMVSLIAAACLALTFIFPPIGAAAFFISTLIGISLTIAAFYFLLSTPATNDQEEDNTKAYTPSHTIITQQLASPKLEPQPSETQRQSALNAPVHSPLFKKEAREIISYQSLRTSLLGP